MKEYIELEAVETALENENKLIDFQEQWDKIVNKANVNYNETSNYNSLTKEEKVWFNIQLLINAVNNGGVISFFYNYEANHYLETIESLKELKQEKVIELLEKIAIIFPEGIVPKDIDERNRIIESLSDEEDEKYDKMFENIDNDFFEIENKLEHDLINYLKINNLV